MCLCVEGGEPGECPDEEGWMGTAGETVQVCEYHQGIYLLEMSGESSSLEQDGMMPSRKMKHWRVTWAQWKARGELQGRGVQAL